MLPKEWPTVEECPDYGVWYRTADGVWRTLSGSAAAAARALQLSLRAGGEFWVFARGIDGALMICGRAKHAASVRGGSRWLRLMGVTEYLDTGLIGATATNGRYVKVELAAIPVWRSCAQSDCPEQYATPELAYATVAGFTMG